MEPVSTKNELKQYRCYISGLGGEDGVYGIEGYLQKRTVYLNYSRTP